MFDIGWTELLLIGIVALIVVGPKDLPGMFRTLGRFTARARQMGREFTRAMDEAAKESGVKDMADDLKSATSKKNLGLDALEQAADKFEKWKPGQTKPGEAKPAARGPATQALADKQAAAAASRKELAQKVRAERESAAAGGTAAPAGALAADPAAPAPAAASDTPPDTPAGTPADTPKDTA